jgi:hypothetical protein
MTVETPFSKSLDALAGFKAEGRQVFGMARTPNGWKLDVQEKTNFMRAGIAEEAKKSQELERSSSPLSQPKDMSAYHGHDVAWQSECNKPLISAGGSTPPPAPISSPEPRTSPLREGRERPEGVSAPVMVKCFDCGVEHPADQECKICAPLARAMIAARERRKKYHDYKHGLASRPI